MKLISRVLPSLLLAATTSVFASSNNDDDSMDQIATYLLNLGQYLGYNVSVAAENPNANPPVTVSQNLLNATNMESMWTYLYDSFLAAFPVNTSNQDPVQLVQPNVTGGSTINGLANAIFSNPAYSSPSTTQPSVSTLIDQQTYQNDPVSQAVLNILGTPDYSYCLDNNGANVVTCNYASNIFNQNEVMANVLGGTPGTFGDSTGIPDTQTFFQYDYNQPFISQLNVNSLMGPLVYSTGTSNTSSGSSGGSATPTQGLTATNQVQQAANFIRYATGAVAPASLPNRSQYDSLYTQAQVTQGATPTVQQVQAQAALASYLLNLRIYAAQTSVGISNLYYILGKRMQLNLPASGTSQQNTPTSQALTEFNMATWRLYNPDQTVNTQWIAQINQASAATVQKEIAGLLAEINYQLYLSRVQQERILLTNTMLLIQNARAAQPTSSLSASAPSSSATGD